MSIFRHARITQDVVDASEEITTETTDQVETTIVLKGTSLCLMACLW